MGKEIETDSVTTIIIKTCKTNSSITVYTLTNTELEDYVFKGEYTSITNDKLAIADVLIQLYLQLKNDNLLNLFDKVSSNLSTLEMLTFCNNEVLLDNYDLLVNIFNVEVLQDEY